MHYTSGLQLFIAFYCLSYLFTFIWIIVLFCRTKRLCQLQTVSFMLFSFVFIILSGHLTNKITKDSWRMQADMSSACDLDAKSGLLYDMNAEFTLAQNQICSLRCPCTLETVPRSQSVFLQQGGAKNVFMCPNAAVSPNSTFSKIFVDLETKTNCSGFCKKNDYPVYTDVNRGEPPQRCYEKVRDLYLSTLLIQIGSCTAVVLITVFTQAFMYLLVIYQVYRRCREKSEEKQKQ